MPGFPFSLYKPVQLINEPILTLLNEYFELIATAVRAYEGEILSFIGDAMLIAFPAAHQHDKARACEAALNAAKTAFKGQETLNEQRQKRHREQEQEQAQGDSLPPITFGIGLHVGDVVYGNVGAPDRLDFTVMGAAVNRTARLESLTKALNTPLLMSCEFAQQINQPLQTMGFHTMKGIAEPQEVLTLPEVL